jgi:peroxiredoxin
MLLMLAATPKIGDSMPSFSRKNAAGKEVSLASLKGKVVLLNFWATYCGPCKEEMPLLSAWHEKFKKKGLVVLAVNVDPESKDALNYLKETPTKFDSLFDPDDTLRESFGADTLPATYLIDRKGKLRVVHDGDLLEDDGDFVKSIKILLKER